MNGDKSKSSLALTLTLYTIVVVLLCAFAYSTTLSSKISFASPLTLFTPTKETSLLVVGDIMLDRNVSNQIQKLGFDNYFAGVKELVSDADIAVGNLEGPFTNNPSLTTSLVNKELVFTFDPKLAPKLAELGFDVLGLANNHTLNFGQDGLESTREYITDANMQYYGDPSNKTELSTIVEKNGIRVGFVGFHEFSYMNFDKVLAEIDRIRPDVDILIVSPHWGVEYKTAPTDFMKKWARLFIDHGADAVIGSHPHVIGGFDEYNGKKIFYSLGNFAFDQYFSDETMKGLAVRIIIDKTGNSTPTLTYSLYSISVDKDGIDVTAPY